MHTTPRRVTKIIEPEPVVEGAGVQLTRSIATATLDEPIARYGPFVMKTKAEIEQALVDLRQGTFVS